MNALQTKNMNLPVKAVGLLALLLVSILSARAETSPALVKVLLLLHGMNSDPNTWNDLVALRFNNSCATIANGVLLESSVPNPQAVLCYRVSFGSFDPISGRVGLEGITTASPLSGDFSTLTQLGREVKRAVNGLVNNYGHAEIVLVAHSRGGLAARAFLQSASQAKANVLGLLTTGTPHRGSQLGRVYKYLKTNTRATCAGQACDADWRVVDFLRGERTCVGVANPDRFDVRRPTVKDLADDSRVLGELNQGINLLPTTLQYGQIVYKKLDLGIFLITDLPFVDAYSIFDRAGKTDVCDQVSKEAEMFMLGDLPPSQYPGDGVIPVAGQRYFNLSGFPGDPAKLHRLRVESGVLHTEETSQEADISKVLTDMMGTWWTGASAVAQGSEQNKATAAWEEKASAHASEPPAALNSVAARQQYFDWLLEQLPEQLWGYWQQLVNNQQWTRLEIATHALAHKLRQAGIEEIYAGIAEILGSPALSPDQKRWVITLLTEAATPQALSIVLDEAVRSQSSPLRSLLLESLVKITNNHWDARFHPELSPALEAVWNEQPDDWELLLAVASGIANVGSADGIALLLKTLDDSGPIVTEEDMDLPARAALLALKKIRNPDAVLILTKELRRADPKDVVFMASGDALAAMGRPEATAALLDWASHAPGEAAPLVKKWLGQARDSGSVQRLPKELLQDQLPPP